MSDTKKNFIYNIIYQILILIIPFITLPYISRVLGKNGIGIYSYTYSIVYYFMCGAILGLNKYGNRTIAKVRDDKEKLSKSFKEIYIMQLMTSTLMIAIYICYLLIFDNEYLDVAWIQLLYIFSSMFDINWFFFGMEKFKLTVTRNTIIKIVSLILIFVFVKNANDVLVYTLILSGSTLLSQLTLFPFLKKIIDIKAKIRIKDVLQHFKPNLIMFLPVIAVAIYGMMDKTMLGYISGVEEVGIYENASKVYNIPISIITALGTVMLPRISNLASKNKNEEINVSIEKSMQFITFLAFPMMMGLMVISNDFVIKFFGIEFSKSGAVLAMLCIIIPIYAWGDVVRNQYIIPKEKDKIYIVSAYLGAIVNLILNLIFIPKFSAIGACIGTISAELVVAFYQSYKIRKELPFGSYVNKIIPYFIKALIMAIVIFFVGKIISTGLLRIIVQVLIGTLLYSLLNIKYIKSILIKNKKI